MMIDTLLAFADEATAQADPVVGSYYVSGNWRGDCCIPGVSVYTVTGTTTVTDPQTGATYQQEQRQPFSGWHIVIALPMLDPALREHAACVLVADRDKAAAGDPSFLIKATVDQATLDAARVEPTFAVGPGDRSYPFGNIP